MTKTILLAITIGIAASHVLAAPYRQIDATLGCRRNPAVVAPCFTVHGRLFIANGTPSMRIWRVGTKRILGVLPSEDEIVPTIIRQHANFDTNLYGDFDVCPFEQETPGSIQSVCVESAAHLVAERFVPEKTAPEVFRIR